MKHDFKKVLLFGSGYMAEEYAKVLRQLKAEVYVIGRNKEKAERLAKKYGFQGYGGGTKALNCFDVKKIDLVIVASAVESLCAIALTCIQKGTKNILIEKPGALTLNELKRMKKKSKGVHIRIAYNRRFCNSVMKLKEKIREDRGALGCFFDFTERERAILNSGKPNAVLNRWGFVNSSHVIDAAFHLIGNPVELNTSRSGSWPNHRTGTTFVGNGKAKNCLFSYFATWAGGGRWNIELSTKEGRYRLSPLEELQFCKKNQFAWDTIPLNDDDDKKFKPGLYKMVKSVLTKKDYKNLPNLNEQIKLCTTVNRIFGYEN